MKLYLGFSSASVAVTLATGVPGGSSSETITSYCFGLKTGSLSFTSCTVITTLAVAALCGVPLSVAKTCNMCLMSHYKLPHYSLCYTQTSFINYPVEHTPTIEPINKM